MNEDRMTLEQEIQHTINRHSAENGSNTPDFILAQFLLGCLAAWDAATNERERWYGRVSAADENAPQIIFGEGGFPPHT